MLRAILPVPMMLMLLIADLLVLEVVGCRQAVKERTESTPRDDGGQDQEDAVGGDQGICAARSTLLRP